MTIHEFWTAVYQNRWYTKRRNILTWFMRIQEAEVDDPLPGQVVRHPGGYYLWTGDDYTFLKENDSPSFMTFVQPITLPPNLFPNVAEVVETTCGSVLVNLLCLVHAFEHCIPFMTGPMTAGRIEKSINELLVDDVAEGEEEPHDKITITMYHKYVVAMRMLMGMSGAIITSATRKNVVAAPGIEAFKAELIKTLDLSDPVDQAIYTKAIQDYDREWLKDDPSNGIMMSGKTRDRARVKVYGAFGVETTFDDRNIDYITQSQDHGLPTDKKSLAALHSSMRAASVSRGKLTAIGGVIAKLLARIVGDTEVTSLDCGTTHYLPRRITKSSKSFLGRYYQTLTGLAVIDTDTLSQLDGKVVQMRSPGHCIEPNNNLCTVCAGQQLSKNGQGVRLASQSVSGQITTQYLKAIHGIDVSATYIPLETIIDEE